MSILQGLDPRFATSRDVVVEVWPETLPAIDLFLLVLTQWRTGPAGRVGLDYLALDRVMDYKAIPMSDRLDLLNDVRSLERGFLSALRS